MKTKIRATKKGLAVLGGLLALTLAPFKSSFALPRGAGVNDCEVTDPSGGLSGRNSVTLRQALNYANQTDRRYQFCRERIVIKTEEINISVPLVISVVVLSDDADATETSEGGDTPTTHSDNSDAFFYSIRGEGAQVKINASNLVNYTGSERKCAIIFRGTHHVKISNINLQNLPPGFDGVCLEDGVNSIHFEDFGITQVQNGNGMIFDERAYDNKILPGSFFDHITGGSAVKLLGAGLQQFNQIIATNRTATEADENGLSDFGTTAPSGGVKNVRLSTIASGDVVSSVKPIGIRINKIEQQGSVEVFRLEGDIVDMSATTDICTAPRYSRSPNIRSIQIYSVQPTGGNGNGIASGEFYKYVMDRATGPGGSGLDLTGSSQGHFRVVIDKTDTHSDMLVFVPELAEHSVGGSSKIVILQDEASDCPDGTVGGSTGSVGGFGVLAQNVMWSKARCEEERRTGTGSLDVMAVDCELDSDGDGLSDCQEDSNGNCQADEEDFSNWMDPDSDDDGILDFIEARGQIPINVFNDDDPATALDDESENQVLNRERGVFCVGDTANLCNVNEATEGVQIASNARDDDADGDGLHDYEEDRQRTLNPWKSAVIKTPDGVEYPCSLGVNQTKGIHWDVYRWSKSEPFDPVLNRHEFESQGLRAIPEGIYLVPLACKSKAVTSTDFNGNRDGNETSPYNIDSDGDCFCDGEDTACIISDEATLTAMGCPDGVEVGDNCPSQNVGDNDCSLECNLKEDLYRIGARSRDLARSYLVFDVSDAEEPVELADGDRNGVKDMFEIADWRQLYQICDDLDGDNIPDCVERMNPSCLETTQSRGALNPYKNDTDNDTIADNFDPNPFTADGNTDITNMTDAGRDALRTTLRIAQVPLLRCFVDRDADGLTDCEEDLDKQDDFDRREVGLEEFLANALGVESDPLKEDSDGDGLVDRLERDVQTNPQKSDTDGDELSDRIELRADARDDYTIRNGAGCTQQIVPEVLPSDSLRLGTNPTNPDTDRDGINDNIEVTCHFLSTVVPGVGNLLANGFTEDIDICSNPLAADSDGDGKSDAEEYARTSSTNNALAPDGLMQYYESSPCDSDTDGDSRPDSSDTCPTSPNLQCTSMGENGPDSDGDLIPDGIEDTNGNGVVDAGETDPNDPDTDNDEISDGEEDIDRDGILELASGETEPRCEPRRADGSCLGLDTDQDGLTDGEEKRLGTYANVADTDADCIPDGREVNFNPFSSFTGTDTDPTSPDSDHDGLCDGDNSQTNGGVAGDVSCIRGEDTNCNGEVDVDANNPNRFIETNPRIGDTDSDGIDDKTEVCTGGRCDLVANIGHATQGAPSGCFSVSSASPFDPSSMLYVYGLVLILNRLFKRRFKRR